MPGGCVCGARAPRKGVLRLISAPTHGVLDYAVGALRILVPYRRSNRALDTLDFPRGVEG